MGNNTPRTWIAIAVALVFAIAAMPGSMAMPAPQPMSHASHAMAAMADCCAQPSDHMKTEKQPNKPCKDMAVCFGMLSCFGLAALPVATTAVTKTVADRSRPAAPQFLSGQTIPPDDPPPIA